MTQERRAVAAILLLLTCAGSARAIVGESSDGGERADETVMLLTRGPEGSGFCTGIVLTPRVILTAAHCLRPAADMRVHFRDAAGAPVILEVESVVVHPEYRKDAQARRTRSIDLGLLTTKIDLPARFRPAKRSEAPAPSPGQNVSVVGYGLQREGEPKTGGALRAARMNVREPRSQVLLWLAPMGEFGGACSGDSGGPIYAEDNSVVALVAWTEGKQGRNCGALTQGVLLAPLRNWLDSTLSRLGQ